MECPILETRDCSAAKKKTGSVVTLLRKALAQIYFRARSGRELVARSFEIARMPELESFRSGPRAIGRPHRRQPRRKRHQPPTFLTGISLSHPCSLPLTPSLDLTLPLYLSSPTSTSLSLYQAPPPLSLSLSLSLSFSLSLSLSLFPPRSQPILFLHARLFLQIVAGGLAVTQMSA